MIEYELDETGKRTGRWRRNQYYAQRQGSGWARLPPRDLKACEWRERR